VSRRLETINLTDFTGGVNTTRSDFQLQPNESPGMLNMEVDPYGGFYTRPGWARWDPTNILTNGLVLPGTVGNYVSTPDRASWQITSDVEVVARLSLLDWTPSTNMVIVGQRNDLANQQSWSVFVGTTGLLRFMHTPSGFSSVIKDSTVPVPATDGLTIWVKATLDVDNGAAGYDVKFYWAADQATEPTTWTQLGATVTTAGVTSAFNSSAAVEIGSRNAGANDLLKGTVRRVIVRNGIGGPVIGSPDFTARWTGNTNIDAQGNVWTINGANSTWLLDLHTAWRPRNAQLHPYSNGTFSVFIANAGKVWAAGPNVAFTDLGLTCSATPHLADPAAWGNTVYIACGRSNPSWKVTNQPAPGNLGAALTVSAAANWNNNYTIPVRGTMPAAEHLEPHSGYLFAANTREDSVVYPNRVRWSHPDEPEDWALNDYIDIEEGGGQITAIRSFDDHLLIFKTDSVHALYGYELSSWQRRKISSSVGTPSPTCVTRSEDAVYFYSATGRNGVYVYQGQTPQEISRKQRWVFDTLANTTDIWLSWMARRLWCSVPWEWEALTDGSHGSLLVYDPENGGSWIRHKPPIGTIACTVEYSDIAAEYPLVVTCGCTGVAGVLAVERHPDIAGDQLVQGQPAVGFHCRYRTSWQDAGWPERQKSFLRPRLIARVSPSTVTIKMSTFWNYNPNDERRSHAFAIQAGGGVFWRALGAADPLGNGFDWGDGSMWGAGVTDRAGDVLVRPRVANPATRGTSLGWARAVQLEFAPSDHTLALAWGVDAIVLKVNMRELTT